MSDSEDFDIWLDSNIDELNDEYFNLGKLRHAFPGDPDANYTDDQGFRDFCHKSHMEAEDRAERRAVDNAFEDNFNS